MYKVVYTKSLDSADDIVAESWECDNKDLAVNLFKDRVNKLLAEVLDNEFLTAKVNIHKFKALVRIESMHHCIAVVDDFNKGI